MAPSNNRKRKYINDFRFEVCDRQTIDYVLEIILLTLLLLSLLFLLLRAIHFLSNESIDRIIIIIIYKIMLCDIHLYSIYIYIYLYNSVSVRSRIDYIIFFSISSICRSSSKKRMCVCFWVCILYKKYIEC